MLHDFRLALRGLVRAPLAATLAIVCLAVGIGTNATMFSVVSTMLVEPLPFPDADRLVTVSSTQQEGGVRRGSTSFLDLQDYQEQASGFETLAGVQGRSLTLSDTDDPERVLGAAVSWRLFSMLGITPALGRDFAAEDDRAGAESVVILSDELWRRRYNGDPQIVGRALNINARPYTVIGVLPPRIKFPFQQVAWVPLAPLNQGLPRQSRDLEVFARVAPGQSVQQATESLTAVAARLAASYPENAGWSVRLDPLAQYDIPGDVRLVTLTAMGAVTLVLLIACANVANLLLARATARAREMSVRAAIGAGRGRIVRQLLTESVLLGLVSGPIGIALAYAGVGALRAGVQADDIPYLIQFRVDGRTLIYTVLISVVTGIIFGLAPAVHAAKADLVSALREGGRTGEGGARNRARNALVIAEVAVSIVLLVGAALFMRSFLNLQRAEAGFDTAPITTARFFMPGDAYAEPDAKLRRVGRCRAARGSSSRRCVGRCLQPDSARWRRRAQSGAHPRQDLRRRARAPAVLRRGVGALPRHAGRDTPARARIHRTRDRYPLRKSPSSTSARRGRCSPRRTRARRCPAFPRIAWQVLAIWARSTRWAGSSRCSPIRSPRPSL